RGARRGGPGSQLEHGRGDSERPARAGDALRCSPGCGALHCPGVHSRRSARRAPGQPGTRPQASTMRRRLPSPAMVVALVALVLSTTGLADAARRAVVSAFAGHRVSTKPYAGAIPTVKDAARVDGKTAEELAGTCPPQTVDLGTWCLDTAPYPLTNAQAGKNNYIWASKACEAEGGWLPTAAQLVGAADRVKLESTIHDSQLTATIDLDPSRGLKDEREMSSTLVTTEAGSAAAGSEGVSEGATGNPRQGQANPVPLPANPLPESLQYVTVYDNGN